MATGFLIASSAVSVIGGAKQYKDTKKFGAEQERLDRENIELEKRETAESIRRTEESQKKTEATAATQVGASGFAVGSSLDRYVNTVKAEHASDIDWMRTSGASRTAISEREASARKRSTDASARSGAISSIGSALGAAGGATVAHKKYGWGF